MFDVALIIFALLVVLFGFVVLFGAPYLPTLSRQVEVALDIAELTPGQRLIELGCGDGKVMIAALKRGYDVTGYELNPILAAVSWLRTRRYGARARVVCGDFWRYKWPETEVIFVFLLPKYMAKLDKKIAQEVGKPVKLVSFAFTIPDRTPALERDGVVRYDYN